MSQTLHAFGLGMLTMSILAGLMKDMETSRQFALLAIAFGILSIAWSVQR